MTVRSKPMIDDAVVQESPRGRRYSPLHGGSVIAHGLSYLTTLWFVQWIWPEGSFTAQSVVAYCLEFLLFAMKSALWNSTQTDDGVGWAGVGIDALINTGGLLPRGDAILTFPPLAIVLSLVGIRVAALPPITMLADGSSLTLAGLLAASAGGMLLSAAPHRLWRAAERRRA